VRTQRGQIYDAPKNPTGEKGSKEESYPMFGYNNWANIDGRRRKEQMAKNKMRRRTARTMQVQNE
jgi:hypothetical protein